MWYFLPGSDTLFALLGLALIIWLIGASLKSAFGGMASSFKSHEKPLSLQKTSDDGRFRIQKAGYDTRLKLYFADVERSDNGEYIGTVTGKTLKEMENFLETSMKWWCKREPEDN